MARSQARIHTSVWRNRDFTSLPASAQGTYWMIVAQADVTMAGTVPYMPDRWSTFRGDPHRLTDDLETLERADFIVIDRATHEAWIRSFVKNDGVLKSPTSRKSMWTAWDGALSPLIRRRFLEQLDELTIRDEQGDEIGVIDEALKRGWVTAAQVREARSEGREDGPSDAPSDAPPHAPSGAPSDGGGDAPPDAPSEGMGDAMPHQGGHAMGHSRATASSSTSSTDSSGGRARVRTTQDDPERTPHDEHTNGRPTPARWDHAWARIARYINRYGQHDDDRPALELDQRSAAALRSIGGLGAVRRDEANRFDFRDAWNALAQEHAHG